LKVIAGHFDNSRQCVGLAQKKTQHYNTRLVLTNQDL
jgi:hypothetical protein